MFSNLFGSFMLMKFDINEHPTCIIITLMFAISVSFAFYSSLVFNHPIIKYMVLFNRRSLKKPSLSISISMIIISVILLFINNLINISIPHGRSLLFDCGMITSAIMNSLTIIIQICVALVSYKIRDHI